MQGSAQLLCLVQFGIVAVFVKQLSQRALVLPHYSPMLKHSRRRPSAALFVISTLHGSGNIKYVVWWMTEDSKFFVGLLTRSASV